MQLHLPSNGGGDVNNACSEVLMDCRLIQSCCHEMNRLLVFYSLVLSLSSSLLAIILWVPRAVGLPVSESGCVTVCFLFISHLLRVCWSPGAGQALGCNTKQRNRAWSLWTRLLGGQGRRFAQSEAECGKGGTEPQVTELFVQLCGQPGPPRGAKIWKTGWIALAQGETRIASLEGAVRAGGIGKLVQSEQRVRTWVKWTWKGRRVLVAQPCRCEGACSHPEQREGTSPVG